MDCKSSSTESKLCDVEGMRAVELVLLLDAFVTARRDAVVTSGLESCRSF
jgi:hypothetical protein